MFIKRRHFNFLIAGLLGFIVDYIVLKVLIDTFGPYYSRIVSFLSAVLTTWVINRAYTFKAKKIHLLLMLKEFVFYFFAMLVGGTANFCTYLLSLKFFSASDFGLLIALVLGTLSGLMINYLSSSRLVFKNQI
ncbi:TPA: GtrA family protein [Vibrio cholerae]|nr:GtrA family protein [Vibrio cholerae]